MTHSHNNPSRNPSSNPNRRFVLAGAAALVALPKGALALSADQSASFVQTVINEVLGIINSGRSEAQVLPLFEALFGRHADIATIARSVLGPAYRAASASQQRAFIAAFQHYMSFKYGRQFNDYRGADISIVRVREAGNAQFLVESQVRQPGKSPFALEWHVFDAGGRPKVFDLIIEGIRMISSEREEVRAMLEAERGDVGALTRRLSAY
ncbi:MAG: ABC transporter substrate-binding protein [Paracoccaceae bacterium]